MEKKIIVGTVLAYIKNNKILLIKRNNPPYVGKICLPGGKIHFGEHVQECAEREFLEETGIKAQCKAIRGVVSEILHEKDEKIQHFLMFVCEMHGDETNIKHSSEGELNWYPIDDLPSDIVPSDKMMIEKYIVEEQLVPSVNVKMIKENENYSMEVE
jgi:8-oxo-dGTP diphosphatase